MLEPAILSRPRLTDSDVKKLIDRLYGLSVTYIKELCSYDDKNFYIEVCPEYRNKHITKLSPDGYVFKVLNGLDSQGNQHVDAEHAMQKLLHANGILCPQPVVNVHGNEFSLERISTETPTATDASDVEKNVTYNVVRLLTFIPGEMLKDVHYNAPLLFQVGQLAGDVDIILKDFSHSACNQPQRLWNLEFFPKMKAYLYTVQDAIIEELVQDVLRAFESEVVAHTEQFTKGVIHGDFSETNLLLQLDAGGHHNVHALLDFGDATLSYHVFEIAITICYMMLDSEIVNPLDVGGHVLAGYLTKVQLTDLEFSVLKTCVAARMAHSLVMGAYSQSKEPNNPNLVLSSINKSKILQDFWSIPNEKIMIRWKQIISSYQ